VAARPRASPSRCCTSEIDARPPRCRCRNGHRNAEYPAGRVTCSSSRAAASS
jgi:hypothetical protein